MPIIGNGDIASAIKEADLNRSNIIYFASGVSNSAETDKSCFERERSLLMLQSRYCHLVYFSTLSVYYGSTTAYLLHKMQMEQLVKTNFLSYTIFRIGNIDWGKNPHTIINFFKSEHLAGRTPELQDAYRHIISKQEFLYWLELMPVWMRDEINIPGVMLSVKQIWEFVKIGFYA